MKSVRYRKAAGFDLFIGILAAIISVAACAMRWLVGSGDAWLQDITKKIAGKPFQVAPKIADGIEKYLKNEYILIAMAVAVVFILLAIILYAVARGAAKKEYACEEEYVEEFEAELEVEAEDESEEEEAKVCWKEKLAKVDSKKLKKIGMIALPVATACVVTVAIASNAKHAKKERRRRKFYEWLG